MKMQISQRGRRFSDADSLSRALFARRTATRKSTGGGGARSHHMMYRKNC
jgi:hypothetical protein